MFACYIFIAQAENELLRIQTSVSKAMLNVYKHIFKMFCNNWPTERKSDIQETSHRNIRRQTGIVIKIANSLWFSFPMNKLELLVPRCHTQDHFENE